MSDAADYGPIGISRRQLLIRGAKLGAGLGMGGLLVACRNGSSSQAGPSSSGSQTNWSPAGGGKPVDSISWALYADLVSTDYAFAYDFNTNAVVTNVVDTLLRLSPTGKLLPNLASSWKQVDPLTYVYTLRQGVKFHDGTEMTAADAAASIERLLDPKLASYLAAFVSHVKSATATGRYELTVRLSEPDALWQYAVATTAGSVSSKAFLAKNGKKVGDPDVGIMGTGPYKYVSWDKGQSAVIEANPDYWNQSRQPKIGKINFKIIQDEATVIESLGTGDINGVFTISGKNLKLLSRFRNVNIARSPSYGVHYLALNTERGPFKDKRLRQALSYAADKAGVLAATWGNDGHLTKSPVTSAMWGFEQQAFQDAYQKLPAFDQDLAKAKSLVQQAGAEGTQITFYVSTPHEKDEGVAVQAAAKQIGLNISLQTVSYTQLIAKISSKTKDYDGVIVEWSADAPDPAGTLSQCFMPGSSSNYSNYDNPAVTKALTGSQKETDPTKRAQLLIQAQAHIVDDQPWVVLFSPNTNMPLSSNLGGYQLRPLWYWDSWAADLSGK